MRSLRAMALVFTLMLNPALGALAEEWPDHQKLAEKIGPAWSKDNPRLEVLQTSASARSLTDEAREVADNLDLPGVITKLDQAKEHVKVAMPNTTDALTARVELLESRQQFEKRLLKASLEVDYVMAAIADEQHRFELMRSELEANRDTSVLLTNIAAQVTNGVLWVLSCSFTIASRTNSLADTPDGINGICAGAVPTALSLYALYQIRGRARDMKANPNMLAPLLGTGHAASNYYPSSVLRFLDSVPKGETKTRRQNLIDHWMANKSISKINSKNYEHSTQLISGTISQKRALTLSLLNKQLTMLSDLRSVVFTMKRGLLELVPATDD